jgi:hypothetical protein
MLNDSADERLLIATGKKPTTGDYYKLLCDHGSRWLPYNWVWTKTPKHEGQYDKEEVVSRC